MRHQECQEDKHQHDRRGEDDARIQERIDHPLAQVFDEFEIGALAFEDLREGSAGLAGGDQVAVERVEGFAAFAESLREADAVAHALAQLGGDEFDLRLFLPLLDNLERTFELEPGFEKLREFLGEIEQLGGGKAREADFRSLSLLRHGPAALSHADRLQPLAPKDSICLRAGGGRDYPARNTALRIGRFVRKIRHVEENLEFRIWNLE